MRGGGKAFLSGSGQARSNRGGSATARAGAGCGPGPHASPTPGRARMLPGLCPCTPLSLPRHVPSPQIKCLQRPKLFDSTAWAGHDGERVGRCSRLPGWVGIRKASGGEKALGRHGSRPGAEAVTRSGRANGSAGLPRKTVEWWEQRALGTGGWGAWRVWRVGGLGFGRKARGPRRAGWGRMGTGFRENPPPHQLLHAPHSAAGMRLVGPER